MLGAIIGDIIGSKYEFNNHRSKDFVLFAEDCFFTDDTVMTLAIAKAIQESDGDPGSLEKNTIRCMQEIGRPYPHCGYGGRFHGWMYSDDPKPYNSFGKTHKVQRLRYQGTNRRRSRKELPFEYG